jgi:hypothetical protein
VGDAVAANRLLDDVADDLSMRQQLAVGFHRDVAKCIQPEFKILCYDSCLRAWARNVNARDCHRRPPSCRAAVDPGHGESVADRPTPSPKSVYLK